MWRVAAVTLVLGAGCTFDHGAPATGDIGSGSSCTSPPGWWNDAYAHRARIETTAPTGYTVHLAASAALATSVAADHADLRVVSEATGELDRTLDQIQGTTFVDFRMPAEGPLWLYTGNAAASAPPQDPARVYDVAESFDTLPIGDNASMKFEPLPPNEWAVRDDGGGNRVYHAEGDGRHPNAFRGFSITDVEIFARMRIGQGGTQQHNGLAARGKSMEPDTMDGFVAQLMGNTMRARIAEYTDGGASPPELTVLDRPVARDQWYALRLRVVGNDLTFQIDDGAPLTATKPGSDGKLVGLYAHDCDVDYDDVRMRMLMTPEPSVQLGPDETRCP